MIDEFRGIKSQQFSRRASALSLLHVPGLTSAAIDAVVSAEKTEASTATMPPTADGGFGLVGDLVIGVIGAFLGGFLFSSLGVSAGGGLVGRLVVATVGAVVLLLLLRLVKRA
jgi:uncharacterized membrane protein YeaQ/YmgE (transglycosylase-associated protein family)